MLVQILRAMTPLRRRKKTLPPKDASKPPDKGVPTVGQTTRLHMMAMLMQRP
ncbi:hypothetical protein [Devosia sp.]|uniref:hypothetical protein n=1 Tax=Devosia sp. TaxID=1871048 RepID=UPI003BAB7A99